MVPDIYRKKQGLGGLGTETEKTGIIGIIDGQLGQKSRNGRQMRFQGLAKMQLGQTGMGVTAVETDKMKHTVQVSKG